MFQHESKVRNTLRGMIRSRSKFLADIAKEAEAATNPRKARHICFLLEAEAIEINDIARMIRSDLKYERARRRQAKIDSGITYAGMKQMRVSSVIDRM
jgi:hypothetical protein